MESQELSGRAMQLGISPNTQVKVRITRISFHEGRVFMVLEDLTRDELLNAVGGCLRAGSVNSFLHRTISDALQVEASRRALQGNGCLRHT